MIDLVLPEARLRFASAIMEMHHDRKQVFVDRLKWDLPVPGSWLEVDDFDNGLAVYLLARCPEGHHLGSVRVLPTVRPHMLSVLFPELCAGEVPTGDDVWEISRLVTSPAGEGGGSVVKVHRLLALALAEFAQLNGIRRYTLVAEVHRVPALLSIGWPVKPLGLPVPVGEEQLQALQIELGPEVLETMRRRLRIFDSVLRVPADQREAA
ncbi:MAG: autoinducer synthase [Pseudomonadota bacterium]|nr:autoinducer synthase [Pseudomonadota bacterium]